LVIDFGQVAWLGRAACKSAISRILTMSRLILTVVGSDRPGLTQALADAVLSAGGNWLESHLSHLGGLYVGSVLVELEAGGVEALRAAAQAVDAKGLEVRIAPALEETDGAGEVVQFTLVGQDRPGIVRKVTGVLSELNVNIEAFDSQISVEPYSGAPLFNMQARLRLPPGLRADRVQSVLEAISGEIMVDISLTPAEGR
jgi:glycine cleavage system regulatory protein